MRNYRFWFHFFNYTVFTYLFLIKSQIKSFISRNNLIYSVVIQVYIFFIKPVKAFHRLYAYGLIGWQQAIIAVAKYGLLKLFRQLFNGLGYNKSPSAHRIKAAYVQWTKSCICAVNEFFTLKHLCQFGFKRYSCSLLIVRTWCNTHGQRDSVSVHKQTHLRNRIRAVFFTWAVFSKPLYKLTGYFVYIILIISFGFKVIVWAVIEADRCIPFHNLTAFFIKMADILIIMLF